MSTEPYIIAEIASAHEGKSDFALKLFRLAATTGADAVKFQIFDRDTLLSRRHHKYDAFGDIQIEPSLWCDILLEAGRGDVDIHVEVFDETSLEVAERAGTVDGYKIPTSDIGNLAHLRRVGETGKAVYLAVGGATMEEIERAVDVLAPACAHPPVLMLGFQAYPTRIEDANLARLEALRRKFDLSVGYADHVDACATELALIVPAMAVAAGAAVIEKHITDDRSRKGRDHYSSLNPDEFANFVRLMRAAASAMGTPEVTLSAPEADYRRVMKRQAVTARAIHVGENFDATQVVFKRTGVDGLSPAEIGALSGKVWQADKKPDDPITIKDFA